MYAKIPAAELLTQFAAYPPHRNRLPAWQAAAAARIQVAVAAYRFAALDYDPEEFPAYGDGYRLLHEESRELWLSEMDDLARSWRDGYLTAAERYVPRYNALVEQFYAQAQFLPALPLPLPTE